MRTTSMLFVVLKILTENRANKAKLQMDQVSLLKAFDRAYLIKWNSSGRTDETSEPEVPNIPLHTSPCTFTLLTLCTTAT